MTFRLHLKNFQSIKETTLDIAPLTFLAGPNSAGKSAVADALAAIGLSFGKTFSGMNLHRLKSFHRDVSEVMTYGMGGDFSLEPYCFSYNYLPFANFPPPSFLDNGYDLEQGDWYLRFESADILFSEVPTQYGMRFSLVIFVNGEKAISCDELNGKVTFYLSNPVISEALSVIELSELFSEDLGDSYFEVTDDVISINADVVIIGHGKTFGVRIADRWSEGIMSYEVVEYISNALIAVIGSACGFFRFALSDEQRIDNGVDPLVHIGPLRVVPSLEEWRVGKLGNVAPADWYNGSFAWSRIAAAIAEAQRKNVCEKMGVETRGMNEGFQEGGFIVNDNLIQDISRLNAALNGYPLRLGYELAGQVKVVVPLSGCEIPLTGIKIAESDFLVAVNVKDDDGRELMLSEVGVGISQVIPVIYAGLTQPFSIIEQPELHLHPKLQLELASFFIAQVGEGRQFILETHSENVFLRVLRAIRETSASDIRARQLSLRADQVSVLYFEKTNDFFTEVHRLRISDDGEFIDRWPDGFFAEREAELF